MNKSFEERVAEAKARVSAVSPQEAYLRMTREPDTLFLDPRDASDIGATTGMIPGAVNVSLSELTEQPASALPAALTDRSRSIITACQVGPMGALAAHALLKRGYKNVRFIDGGTQGWLDAGFATR